MAPLPEPLPHYGSITKWIGGHTQLSLNRAKALPVDDSDRQNIPSSSSETSHPSRDKPFSSFQKRPYSLVGLKEAKDGSEKKREELC